MPEYILDFNHFIEEYALNEFIAFTGFETTDNNPQFKKWFNDTFIPQLKTYIS